MSLKTVIVGVAAAAIVAATVLTATDASAQRRGPGGFHPGGGVHVGGGFHPGGGFRGYRGRYGWGGIYPWLGYGGYPWPYYFGPSCGYVRVIYYRHGRAHWHWVYECD